MDNKNNSSESLSRSFIRDYLIAFVPSLLLLMIIGGIGFKIGINYFTNLIVDTTHELNGYAEQHLRALGEQFIKTKASDTAKQVEIYLKSNPNISMQELQNDPYFKSIAVQTVGQTGYTCMYEVPSGIVRIHPNQSIIDKDMSVIGKKLPSWWEIIKNSLTGNQFSGYYDWIEPNGSVRQKYMTSTPVNHQFNNLTLIISATTYIDEFSSPINDMRAKSDVIRLNSQNFIRHQSIMFGTAGVMLIIFMLLTTLWLLRRTKSRYIRPIEQLSEVAVQLGDGNWDTSDHLDSLSNRSDEIGKLALALQSMTDKLMELFKMQEQRMQELILAEAAISESQIKFKSIFEKNYDTMMLLTHKGFFDCNSRTLEMFGFDSKDEFISVHPSQISPTYQPDGQDSLTASNELIKTAIEKGYCSFEWMHCRKNGEEFLTEVILSSYQLGSETVVQATVRDISERKRIEAELIEHRTRLEELVQERTSELQNFIEKMENEIIERKRAEAAISESQQLLAGIIDFLPDPTFVIDTQGKIISWNKAIEDLSGKSADEMLGKGDQEYAIPFYGERRPILIDLVNIPDKEFQERYSSIKREGNVLFGETYVPHLRGGGVYLAATACALKDSKGNPAGAIETIRDISERKKLEEVLQHAKESAESANRAKSSFLATMSHEIRTPMNGVIGMTGLLLDTEMTKDQKMFAENIRKSGEALLTIINDILDFSKIEAGQFELEYMPFNLRECVESALDMVSVKANEKGLELAFIIDSNLPTAINGDETRLRQILLNLLSNAVKFTEKGEVVVSVSASDLQNNDYGSAGETKSSSAEKTTPDSVEEPLSKIYEIKFSVKDTGIGIPANRIDKLFKSFSQVDSSTSRKYGGTGLGLVISKKLTQMMGGDIQIESIEGVGTTFHFFVKAEAASMAQPIYMSSDQPYLRGKRVLIVDDNEVNREILLSQTSSWAMVPQAVSSGAEALNRIIESFNIIDSEFDLAILDLNMPEMDGLELAQAIHSQSKTEKLPLIMLSSSGQMEKGPIREEFKAWLFKPVKASQLHNTLIEVFARDVNRTHIDEDEDSEYDPNMGKDHPLRILIAEDNSINQQLAMLTLERLGYVADIAGNGLEAVDAVRRQHYDTVLMDIQMPEMDGMDAAKQIRKELPIDRQPHIIAMTANVMQGDRDMCLSAGMDDYISKPFKVKALIKALMRCKSRKKVGKKLESNIVSTISSAKTDLTSSQTEKDNDISSVKDGEKQKNIVDIELTSSPANLDQSALKRLNAMLGKKAAIMLPKLIEDFFKDAVKMQQQARQSMEQGRHEELRRAVHTLKSNAKNFGAATLAELCQESENIAKSGSTNVSDILDKIESEFSRVKLALENILVI
ncbi:MAG: response regulator [Desulfamplus sp.]|nr:response regulator [Desulfamplus sp.]